MNIWGFNKSMLTELKNRFPAFLEEGLKNNPEKCEYFLPNVVGDLLDEGKATVKVLPCEDRWYGVTYREDKPVVVQAIEDMKNLGYSNGYLYPHDFPGHYVEQQYLPDEMVGTKYYIKDENIDL